MQKSELTQALFNNPSLRMLPDMIFFNLANGVTVPTDQMGLLKTKDEIREVVRVLTAYIDLFPDNQTAQLRKEFFMKHHPERFGLPRKRIVKKSRDRSGFVYLIYRHHDNAYKIGRSKTPNARLKVIQNASGTKVTLDHTFYSDDAIESEYDLHRMYQSKAMGGEWFKLNKSDVEYIKSISAYKNGEFTNE